MTINLTSRDAAAHGHTRTSILCRHPCDLRCFVTGERSADGCTCACLRGPAQAGIRQHCIADVQTRTRSGITRYNSISERTAFRH
ncbi:hypothetical protein OWZ45_004581 [Salmonella enterica]|nr:hypothetical protein [Salmonella enterica]